MHTILYPVNQLRIGGAEQQLLELVRGLDPTTFHPIVAPLYPGGALTEEFRAIPGVDVIELNRKGKFDPLPLWKIARLLHVHQVDIVQPFLSPATFFGLTPALAVGTPVMIVTERCGVRRSRGIGYRTYRFVEDWMSRTADAIIPNSAAGKAMLIERGLPAGKIRVIYNGINERRLQADPERVAAVRETLSTPPDGIVIGILASLTSAKGHETLLRAIASPRIRNHPIRLAIVGDGPQRQHLEALTNELGIRDQVVFFGYQRNVADFVAAFDILVSASCDNEGCSNSILEAMTLGVPVIATDIGGNREVVRHRQTGHLTQPSDSESLAETIAHVVDDPAGTARIIARARGMIEEQFSLERMVREYEMLYTQLLSRQSAPALDADGIVAYSPDHPPYGSAH